MNKNGVEFDVETGSYLIACLAGLWAMMAWPFKTFMTKKACAAKCDVADKTFLKKVEPDGTRLYVHHEEWGDMKTKLDKVIESNDKWQKLAQEWMKNP